jgi:membrane protein implicated in regulation of membrane protease activity
MEAAEFPIMLPLMHALLAALALMVSTVAALELWRRFASRRRRPELPRARTLTGSRARRRRSADDTRG